jgi:hypothetical protein
MVKSLRYVQVHCHVYRCFVANRVRRAGHADADAHSYGYSAPDRDTAPHGHADAGTDLSAAESGGGVGAARCVR